MPHTIKNISLFANAGIGEYGTTHIEAKMDDKTYTIKTIIANELLEERVHIYKENYTTCNMICGSITDKKTFSQINDEFQSKKPTTGTFSPPCQGSSGLNAFKGKETDFRNQLVKSIFQLFEQNKDNNSLEYGYIENVVSYYNEEIPCLIQTKNGTQLNHNYIVTKEDSYLNYKYFVFFNDHTQIKTILKLTEKNIFELEDNNVFNYKYVFGVHELSQLEINKLIEVTTLLLPLTIKEYIERSLHSYGYKGELQTIRGEEYGAPQVRQRGFFIFYKEYLNLTFPKPLFNTSKNKATYNGHTMEMAFKTMNLLKIYSKLDYEKAIKEKEVFNGVLIESMPFKIKKGCYYIDTSISTKEAEIQLENWKAQGYDNNKIPNLHFREELKGRYLEWVTHTKEGESAYKNKERIHRPYKLIKVEKKNNDYKISNEHTFIVREDTQEYFLNNNIIDYVNYLTQELIEEENNPKEWKSGERNWMLRNIQVRDKLENILIEVAKNELKDNDSINYKLIFFPIKGFEAATYKRGNLDLPSNALTTKMGYGNSNTVHPIFDRVLTPAEVMSLFGLGYVIDIEKNNTYKLSNPYIPPKNIKNIKTFQNLIYEILGEAIISLVAESVLKDLTIQFLNHNNKQ